MTMSEQNQRWYEESFKRPANFFQLSAEDQWAWDKSLGILDWDGSQMTDEEYERYRKHYKPNLKPRKKEKR